MTQQYGEGRTVTPVTLVRVGAGVVTQVKTDDSDGYTAVQVGYNEGSKHVTQAMQGHTKKAIERPLLKEFRFDKVDTFEVGQRYDLSNFEVGDIVSVTGTSKGRGFAGVVKRHHFAGSPKTHGHKHDLRAPGSIGATDPARVFPGMRMAGRMGGEQVTTKNLEILSVDAENGILAIKGALPGPRGGVIIIKGDGDMKPMTDEKQVEDTQQVPEPSTENVEKKEVTEESQEKAQS